MVVFGPNLWRPVNERWALRVKPDPVKKRGAPHVSPARCVTLTVICQYGIILSLWLRLNSRIAPETFTLRGTGKARLMQRLARSCMYCSRKQLQDRKSTRLELQ